MILPQMQTTAKLTRRVDLTEDLAIFTFDLSPNIEFKPGQYVTLAIQDEEGKLIPRPYSISSPPSDLPFVESFIKLVNEEGKGKFTKKLFQSNIGDEFKVMKVGGTFIISEHETRDIIMVSSGTGISPYISMVLERVEKFKDGKTFENKFIIAQGVRHSSDIPYKEEMQEAIDLGIVEQFIPTVSREEENWNGEKGRVENLFITDKIEEILKEELDKKKYIVYLCGHPEMIEKITEHLKTKGFEEGVDIKFEKYWS